MYKIEVTTYSKHPPFQVYIDVWVIPWGDVENCSEAESLAVDNSYEKYGGMEKVEFVRICYLL